MQISRLSSGKSFRGKRKKFIFNAFIDFKPMSRFENRGDVTEFGSLNHSRLFSTQFVVYDDNWYNNLWRCRFIT